MLEKICEESQELVSTTSSEGTSPCNMLIALPQQSSMAVTNIESMWKMVESNETIRSMSQLPHFQPLQNHPEHLREGQAIGYKLSYLSLVDKINKSKTDEPKSVLEKMLEALVKLETLGFDFEHIKPRLMEMIRLKDSEIQASALSQEAEEKLGIDQSVVVVNELIKGMQEKLEIVEI